MTNDKKYLTHEEIRNTVDTAYKEVLYARDLLDTDGHYKEEFDVDHGYEAFRVLENTRDRLKELREKAKQYRIVEEEPKEPVEED